MAGKGGAIALVALAGVGALAFFGVKKAKAAEKKPAANKPGTDAGTPPPPPKDPARPVGEGRIGNVFPGVPDPIAFAGLGRAARAQAECPQIPEDQRVAIGDVYVSEVAGDPIGALDRYTRAIQDLCPGFAPGPHDEQLGKDAYVAMFADVDPGLGGLVAAEDAEAVEEPPMDLPPFVAAETILARVETALGAFTTPEELDALADQLEAEAAVATDPHVANTAMAGAAVLRGRAESIRTANAAGVDPPPLVPPPPTLISDEEPPQVAQGMQAVADAINRCGSDLDIQNKMALAQQVFTSDVFIRPKRALDNLRASLDAICPPDGSSGVGDGSGDGSGDPVQLAAMIVSEGAGKNSCDIAAGFIIAFQRAAGLAPTGFYDHATAFAVAAQLGTFAIPAPCATPGLGQPPEDTILTQFDPNLLGSFTS